MHLQRHHTIAPCITAPTSTRVLASTTQHLQRPSGHSSMQGLLCATTSAHSKEQMPNPTSHRLSTLHALELSSAFRHLPSEQQNSGPQHRPVSLPHFSLDLSLSSLAFSCARHVAGNRSHTRLSLALPHTRPEYRMSHLLQTAVDPPQFERSLRGFLRSRSAQQLPPVRGPKPVAGEQQTVTTLLVLVFTLLPGLMTSLLSRSWTARLATPHLPASSATVLTAFLLMFLNTEFRRAKLRPRGLRKPLTKSHSTDGKASTSGDGEGLGTGDGEGDDRGVGLGPTGTGACTYSKQEGELSMCVCV